MNFERQRILSEMVNLAPWHFDIEVVPGLRTSEANRAEYDNANHTNVRVTDPEELKPLLTKIFPPGLGRWMQQRRLLLPGPAPRGQSSIRGRSTGTLDQASAILERPSR